MYKKKIVLDQKLIRENPTLVEESLSLRGKVFNISQIQKLTLQKKEDQIIGFLFPLSSIEQMDSQVQNLNKQL